MMSAHERYKTDAQFRFLVDAILGALHQAEYTPSEVREAAILACIKYEMTHLKAMRMTLDHEAGRHLQALESWMLATETKERTDP